MQNPLLIFLVDDDPDDREMFSLVMDEVTGAAQYVFAYDGVHALERIHEDATFIPNLVFIDINMPRMNGIRLLEEIKKISRLSSTPVYMYSTYAEAGLVQRCLSIGASGFMKKHVDTVKMREEFGDLIQRLS